MKNPNEMNTEAEAVLLKKIEETESNSRSKIEVLMAHSNGLQLEVNNLHAQKAQLNDASSLVNNIMNQVSFLQHEVQSLSSPNTKSVANENLRSELDALRTENVRLHLRISEMEKENTKTVSNQNEIIKKLTIENKLAKQLSEKKIQETAGELRKSLEDRIRMMSRRIKVAEQLHVENKEVYMKARDKYSQEKTDMRVIGDMMNELNSVSIKFEEFSGDIVKRMSTISCWAVFAKEWIRGKGDEEKKKEEEMMGLREKVKEMEKVVKEKEEEMAVVGEGKREAIRQLCVWIDYYRNNSSDYLKEMIPRK